MSHTGHLVDSDESQGAASDNSASGDGGHVDVAADAAAAAAGNGGVRASAEGGTGAGPGPGHGAGAGDSADAGPGAGDGAGSGAGAGVGVDGATPTEAADGAGGAGAGESTLHDLLAAVLHGEALPDDLQPFAPIIQRWRGEVQAEFEPPVAVDSDHDANDDSSSDGSGDDDSSGAGEGDAASDAEVANWERHFYSPHTGALVANVWCNACDRLLCDRGMSVSLCADVSQQLFSTDLVTRCIVEVGARRTIDTCRCRVVDIACVNCRTVVGYHVVKPCHGCLSADNNGHYWMMRGDDVHGEVRRDETGATMPWATLPACDTIDDAPIVFAADCTPPAALSCAICMEVFQDPHVLPCGHTFCKVCIVRQVDIRHKCPLDNLKTRHARIVGNRVVAEIVGDLRIHCRYGLKQNTATGVWEPVVPAGDSITDAADTTGAGAGAGAASGAAAADGTGARAFACAKIIKLGARDAHESSCPYRNHRKRPRAPSAGQGSREGATDGAGAGADAGSGAGGSEGAAPVSSK